MAASGHNYLRTINFKLEKSQLNSLGYLGYNGMIYRRDNEFNGEDWFFSTKWGSLEPANIQKLIPNSDSSIWFIREGNGCDAIIYLTINEYIPVKYTDFKYGFDRISIEFREGFKPHFSNLFEKYLKGYKTSIKSNVLRIESNGYLYKSSCNEFSHVLISNDKSIEIIKPHELRDDWRRKDSDFFNCTFGKPKELSEFLEIIFKSSFSKECHFLKKDKKIIGIKRDLDFSEFDSEYYAYWEAELKYDDERDWERTRIEYRHKNYFHWDFCDNENYLNWLDKYKNKHSS